MGVRYLVCYLKDWKSFMPCLFVDLKGDVNQNVNGCILHKSLMESSQYLEISCSISFSIFGTLTLPFSCNGASRVYTQYCALFLHNYGYLSISA